MALARYPADLALASLGLGIWLFPLAEQAVQIWWFSSGSCRHHCEVFSSKAAAPALAALQRAYWYMADTDVDNVLNEDLDNDFSRAGIDIDMGVYGELIPTAVLAMLRKAGARPGHVFFDLGSGWGKIASLAWLMGMNATGVELGEVRWKEACAAADRLSSHSSSRGLGTPGALRFVHASFLDVDFSGADIIFTNSLLWSEDVMQQLGRLTKWMRAGAIIITHQGLHGDHLKTVGEIDLHTTWGEDGDTTVYTLQKVRESAAGQSSSARKARRRRETKACVV